MGAVEQPRHGYLEVSLVDPWTVGSLSFSEGLLFEEGAGAPDDFVAIDFVELSLNQDSLLCDGDCGETGDFERVAIGDIDGFGWADGAVLVEEGLASSNQDWRNAPAMQPVNLDGLGLLAPGDFLPDVDENGHAQVGNLAKDAAPFDDWDMRSGVERGRAHLTGRGFEPGEGLAFGSEFTDITLSQSYSTSQNFLEAEADPVFRPEYARVLHAFPTADGESWEGSNQPGKGDNAPFIFDFYVDPFDLVEGAPLYFNIIFADYEVNLVKVELTAGVPPKEVKEQTVDLTRQSGTENGLIQFAFAPLDGTLQAGSTGDAIGFNDIFTWENGRWHGYLEARFLDALDVESGEGEGEPVYEPYTAFDFVELSTNLNSIGLIRVPDDYPTIQGAIDAASELGNTIMVSPGVYRENIDFKGKDIVLRSLDPFDPEVVADTIIDGDTDNDGTGDGPVVSFRGYETKLCALSGFTIRNGVGVYGGGIAGYGTGATVRNNVITGNEANYGGGICLVRGTVEGNWISNNEAVYDAQKEGSGTGGGVWTCSTLIANTLTGNTSASKGAGAFQTARYGYLVFTNNVVYDNTVTGTVDTEAVGGGLHVQGGFGGQAGPAAFVANNTFVENGGGVDDANLIAEGVDLLLTNCIVWGGYMNDGSDDIDRLEDVAAYCNIQGAPALSGGIAAPWNFGDNPQFANLTERDLHSTSASPGIDLGQVTTPQVSTDRDGVRRSFLPDVGAYEYYSPAAVPVYISGPGLVESGEDVLLSAKLSDALQEKQEQGLLTYAWSFNGQATGTNSPTLLITDVQLTHTGTYRVNVYDGAATAYSRPHTLLVLPGGGPAGEGEGEGEGEPEDPRIAVSPPVVWLGSVPSGTPVDVKLYVSNLGGGTLTGSASIIDGPLSFHFSDTDQYSLSAGQTHEVHVRCTAPAGAGSFMGRVQFSGGGGTTVYVSGQTANTDSPEARMEAYPSLLQFGYVAVGQTLDRTITVTNAGTGTLVGGALVAAPFSTVGTATYQLAPGEPQDLVIRFAPTSQADYTEQVILSGGGGVTIQAVGSGKPVTNSPTTGVRLNELLPWNTNGIQTANGDYEDWIELYNENTVPVDMAGWTLTDNVNPVFTFPSFVVPAKGYALVYASIEANPPNGELHTGFELDEVNGGDVALFSPGELENSTSEVEYPSNPIKYRSFAFGAAGSSISIGPMWGTAIPTPFFVNSFGRHYYFSVFTNQDCAYNSSGPVFFDAGIPVNGFDPVNPDNSILKDYQEVVEQIFTISRNCLLRDDTNSHIESIEDTREYRIRGCVN